MAPETPDTSSVPKKSPTEQRDTTPPLARHPVFLGLAAGSAIGLVVGLIAGLSISPVTSTILGALSASLLILLGLKSSKGGQDSQSHDARVLGFGLLCSISLLVGIGLRTHQILSPPIEAQKDRLTSLKVFTPDEVSQILMATNFGLERASRADVDNVAKSGQGEQSGSTDTSKTSKEKDRPTLRATNGDVQNAGLLRAGSVEFCQIGRRELFRDLNAYLAELHQIDPKLERVIETAPTSYQDDLSKSLSKYLCP
jgi:hypothetical protein